MGRYIGTKLGSSIDTCGITPVVNGVLSVKGSDVTKAAVVPVGPALKTQEAQWNSTGPMNLGYDFNVQTDSALPPDGWSMSNGAWNTNAVWSTNAQTGGHSLEFPSQAFPFVGQYGVVSGYIPITDSQSLRLVALISSSYNSSAANFPFTFKLTWYDGSKASTGSPTSSAPKGAAAGTWVQRSITATAPSGARYVTVTVEDHGGTNGIKYADYVQLLDSGSAVPSGGSTGSTFPTSPNTSDRFFRTDLGLDCYYDGARWLTLNEYVVSLSAYGALPNGVAASGSVLVGKLPDSPSGHVWLTKWSLFSNTAGASSGLAKWQFQLENDAATQYGSTVDTSTTPDAANTTIEHVQTGLNSDLTVSTSHYLFVKATKTGVIANTSIGSVFHCRLIVT